MRPTLLVVGEGYAEEALLRHMRGHYTAKGQGCEVTIKNARGRGAQHVVVYAARLVDGADYDRVIALLDTDTCWTDKARQLARSKKIVVLPCDPCLEAWLLALAGHRVREGLDSKALKSQFEAIFGGEAHDSKVYERHFSKDILDAAMERDKMLAALIEAMRL